MLNKKIIVFSGPSGGHLFPAQAFAEAVREVLPRTELILVTSERAGGLCLKFPAGLFDEIVFLPEFGAPAIFSFSGLKAILNIPAAVFKSAGLILRVKPGLCVGFGSFVSYFGVLFAVWKGIPTLIHEQNQVPGKATRMLQGIVSQVAVSFPKTQFITPPKSVVVTGLPIRRALRCEIIEMNKKPTEKFVVLVCGGSQGSAFLNGAVLKCFSLFSPEERAQFVVIHITGIDQDSQVRSEYLRMGMNAEVYPFFEAIQLVYNRAHMAISRAGANSSFEQALYGIPTAFIPYPFAEGHQKENADYFVQNGGAVRHDQDDAAAEWIAGVLRNWVKRPENYWTVSRKMRELSQARGHQLLLEAARKLLEKK